MASVPKTIFAALLGFGLLAAPALADRIRLVNINGYSVIDREHLVLNGGVSRHYLVTLRSPCPELTGGFQLGMSFPSTTTIVSPHMEYVYPRRTIGMSSMDMVQGRRCYIDTIEDVESPEAARVLVEERAAAEEATGNGEAGSDR